MKLLLVDDDAFLRDMYATKFSEAGDTVEVAESGEQALVLLESHEYDAVITDMIMPGLTGPDLVKQVVARGVTCVVLSNQGEQSDIDAATAAGARGYLVKAELVPSEVVAKIHHLIK